MTEVELLHQGAVLDSAGDLEESYARAARAPATLRGYRSDWAEFTRWCVDQDLAPLPAPDVAISGYLVMLASAGAKVGTMSPQRTEGERFLVRSACA